MDLLYKNMKKVPYDVNDRDELKERLNLYFEPTPAIHIFRLQSRKNCVMKFVPRMTSSGTNVSNDCLKRLIKDDIIEKRYDNTSDIKKDSELENKDVKP